MTNEIAGSGTIPEVLTMTMKGNFYLLTITSSFYFRPFGALFGGGRKSVFPYLDLNKNVLGIEQQQTTYL